MKSRLKFTAYSKRAKYVIYPSAIVAAVDFLAFIAGSIHFGGDALNGYVKAGQYFVCAHGSCTEVSRAIWHYSYWHAWAAIAGILLVMAETALFLNTGDIAWE